MPGDFSRSARFTKAFDFAIKKKLIRALGGIPMKASPPAIPQKPMLMPVRRIDDKVYAAYLEPISRYWS